MRIIQESEQLLMQSLHNGSSICEPSFRIRSTLIILISTTIGPLQLLLADSAVRWHLLVFQQHDLHECFRFVYMYIIQIHLWSNHCTNLWKSDQSLLWTFVMGVVSACLLSISQGIKWLKIFMKSMEQFKKLSKQLKSSGPRWKKHVQSTWLNDYKHFWTIGMTWPHHRMLHSMFEGS
jgi:hypothetical protein